LGNAGVCERTSGAQGHANVDRRRQRAAASTLMLQGGRFVGGGRRARSVSTFIFRPLRRATPHPAGTRMPI
jgi:hypothetical protein